MCNDCTCRRAKIHRQNSLAYQKVQSSIVICTKQLNYLEQVCESCMNVCETNELVRSILVHRNKKSENGNTKQQPPAIVSGVYRRGSNVQLKRHAFLQLGQMKDSSCNWWWWWLLATAYLTGIVSSFRLHQVNIARDKKTLNCNAMLQKLV